MARSRNIKPAFFKNEDLADLPFEARLLFAGLWCMADRAGRLEDRPRRLKVELFPYDDVDIDDLLRQLAESPGRFIIRYSVGGQGYVEISAFSQHQNPHKAECESKIPAAPGENDIGAPDKNGTCTGQEPDKHGASTVQERNKHRSRPADSLNLIPDSLNLIPDSLNLIPSSSATAAACSLDGLIEKWNKIPGVGNCRKATDSRRKTFKTRIKDPDWCDNLDAALQRVAASQFCRGGGSQGWKADLDWFLKPDTLTKLLEGKYDDGSRATSKGQGGRPGRPVGNNSAARVRSGRPMPDKRYRASQDGT